MGSYGTAIRFRMTAMGFFGPAMQLYGAVMGQSANLIRSHKAVMDS